MRAIIIPQEQVEFLKQWNNGPYKLEPIERDIGYVVGINVINDPMYSDIRDLLLTFEQVVIAPHYDEEVE